MGIFRTPSGRFVARVVHRECRGIRVTLGNFANENAARNAALEYNRTGILPPSDCPRFRDVECDERGRWWYTFEGEYYGPFANEFAAAKRRRRDKDNATQRMRRAEERKNRTDRAYQGAKVKKPQADTKRHAMDTRSRTPQTQDRRRPDTPTPEPASDSEQEDEPAQTPKPALQTRWVPSYDTNSPILIRSALSLANTWGDCGHV
jgi:hypothetical protein